MTAPWLRIDACWLNDRGVRDAGDDHGAVGPLVYIALLAACKLDGSDGHVTIRPRWVARDTFTSTDTLRLVLASLAASGLIEVADVPDAAGEEIAITITRWSKYQKDPTAAERAREYRERNGNQPLNGAKSEAIVTDASRNRHGTVTESPRAKTGTRTKDKSKNDVEQNARPIADSDPIMVVFDAWRDATGKRDARITGTAGAKRRRRIAAALAEYPLADVTDAVKGWRHIPHNRGDNDRGRPFNDIDLVLRDAQHIELFRDAERSHRDADTQVRDDVAATAERIRATLASTARTA